MISCGMIIVYNFRMFMQKLRIYMHKNMQKMWENMQKNMEKFFINSIDK